MDIPISASPQKTRKSPRIKIEGNSGSDPSDPESPMDRMRLDLFLKWSRVILRRSLAKDTCDAGRVVVNGQEAKAGREVRVTARPSPSAMCRP